MDDERVHFPEMKRATDEEWQRLQPLLEKAKAEGNPWAYAAGIFRDDASFDEWVDIMRENRRKADEEPELWHSG